MRYRIERRKANASQHLLSLTLPAVVVRFPRPWMKDGRPTALVCGKSTEYFFYVDRPPGLIGTSKDIEKDHETHRRFRSPRRDPLVSGQLRLYLEFPHGNPRYRNPAYGMVRSRYAGPGVDKGRLMSTYLPWLRSRPIPFLELKWLSSVDSQKRVTTYLYLQVV